MPAEPLARPALPIGKPRTTSAGGQKQSAREFGTDKHWMRCLYLRLKPHFRPLGEMGGVRGDADLVSDIPHPPSPAMRARVLQAAG